MDDNNEASRRPLYGPIEYWRYVDFLQMTELKTSGTLTVAKATMVERPIDAGLRRPTYG